MDKCKEGAQMILRNQTGVLMDRPHHKKAIGVKWVYRTKLNPDGSIDKQMKRLVVNRYT